MYTVRFLFDISIILLNKHFMNKNMLLRLIWDQSLLKWYQIFLNSIKIKQLFEIRVSSIEQETMLKDWINNW